MTSVSGISPCLTSAKGPLPDRMIPCTPSGTVDLPKEIRKVQGAIYGFFDKENDRFYVGKTDTTVAARINKHNQSTRKGSDDFHREMRNRPDDFYFCLFHTALNRDELLLKEIETIAAYEASIDGYNGNNGGGGGVSKRGCLTPVRARRSEGLEGEDLTQITPDRYFPLKVDAKKRKAQFQLTPKTAKKKDVIYVIKDNTTDRRYIGETGNTLSRRASQHLYFVRHSEAHSSNQVYEEMREHPDDFSIGILHECKDPTNAAGMETAFIEAKDSLVSGSGFNKTKGGNGSFSRRIFEAIDP